MAEENQNIMSHGYQQPAAPATHDESAAPEIKDRGFFDFSGKKKEEEEKVPTSAQQDVGIATELEHVHVSECKEEEEEPVKKKEDEKKQHSSLREKLHRSDSSSSCSSEEEVEEGGEKIRRKKKGLKEKIKERISGEKKVEEEEEKKVDNYNYSEDNTTVPIEKPDDVVVTHGGVTPHPEEENQGFLEKIKEKISAGKKQPEDHQGTYPAPAPPAQYSTDAHNQDGEEVKEKKGFLEKIKEKFPGYHKTSDQDDQEKKETTNY